MPASPTKGAGRLSLADVLLAGLASARKKFGFGAHHWKAFNAIIACRTGRLGAHIYKCGSCDRRHLVPHSCRDRHCPRCQRHAADEWLALQEQALLPVRYHHVVFTLPHQLNALVRSNQKELLGALFDAASQTLLAFGRNNLKAQLGITAVLHTWGQTLCEHYHLHCIVTGGGLDEDGGSWVLPRGRKPYLFSVRALSKVYRAKFLAAVEKLHAGGRLEFHGESEPLGAGGALANLTRTLSRRKWVVYSKAPFAGPKQVLGYLSRYTHRVAIANSRLVRMDESRKEVTFSYKDYRMDGKAREMTLSTDDFIGRFSLHILPKGFTKIRHYGILSTRNRGAKVALCRRLLGAGDSTDHTPELSGRVSALRPEPKLCPHCKAGALVLIDVVHCPVRMPTGRAPPRQSQTDE
jgi:hypothetical protein